MAPPYGSGFARASTDSPVNRARCRSANLGIFHWTMRSHFTMCGKGFTPRKAAFRSSNAISHVWRSGKPM